jgi:hypothetical protein
MMDLAGEAAECRKCSLAEADASVVGGDFVICPDLDRSGLQHRVHVFKEKLVLKDAAGERGCVNFAGLQKRQERVGKAPSDAARKGPGYLRWLAAARTVICHSLQQRAKIEFAAVEREMIGIGVVRGAREVRSQV